LGEHLCDGLRWRPRVFTKKFVVLIPLQEKEDTSEDFSGEGLDIGGLGVGMHRAVRVGQRNAVEVTDL
jgi:hypothetical protein